MKVRARSVVVAVSLLSGIWAVSCGGGDEPTKVPVYTAGNSGTQSGASGEQGGAGTTGEAGGGGRAEGGTTGEAGRNAGTSGEAGKGTSGEAGSGATGAAGSHSTGEAGTTGAAGSATTGAAGSGNTGAAGGGTTGAAGRGAAGAGGTTGAGGATGAGGGGAARAEVQAILNTNCIVCHGTSGGMSLADVSRIVGAASSECSAKTRVAAGSPMTSYIIDKLMGASQTTGGCFSGMRMPRGRAALSAANIATIASWIRAGAN